MHLEQQVKCEKWMKDHEPRLSSEKQKQYMYVCVCVHSCCDQKIYFEELSLRKYFDLETFAGQIKHMQAMH